MMRYSLYNGGILGWGVGGGIDWVEDAINFHLGCNLGVGGSGLDGSF